jgi:hypothetical protein
MCQAYAERMLGVYSVLRRRCPHVCRGSNASLLSVWFYNNPPTLDTVLSFYILPILTSCQHPVVTFRLQQHMITHVNAFNTHGLGNRGPFFPARTAPVCSLAGHNVQ